MKIYFNSIAQLNTYFPTCTHFRIDLNSIEFCKLLNKSSKKSEQIIRWKVQKKKTLSSKNVRFFFNLMDIFLQFFF